MPWFDQAPGFLEHRLARERDVCPARTSGALQRRARSALASSSGPARPDHEPPRTRSGRQQQAAAPSPRCSPACSRRDDQPFVPLPEQRAPLGELDAKRGSPSDAALRSPPRHLVGSESGSLIPAGVTRPQASGNSRITAMTRSSTRGSWQIASCQTRASGSSSIRPCRLDAGDGHRRACQQLVAEQHEPGRDRRQQPRARERRRALRVRRGDDRGGPDQPQRRNRADLQGRNQQRLQADRAEHASLLEQPGDIPALVHGRDRQQEPARRRQFLLAQNASQVRLDLERRHRQPARHSTLGPCATLSLASDATPLFGNAALTICKSRVTVL